MKQVFYKKSLKMTRIFFALAMCLSLSGLPAFASSHGEAPLISMDRFADNTDTYAFRSVEAGRSGFVTLIGNWIPLQEPSGGPQFFRWDDTVLYEIKIDNTGDGIEDITYQWQFTTQTVNTNTVLGHSTVNADGAITSLTDPDYNQPQTYSIRRIDRASGRRGRIIAAGLRTPPANIGPRVTPNYETNLGLPAVYNLPNGGKTFAGTRDEYFYFDLGLFDAINLRTLTVGGSGLGVGNGIDSTQGYNVSTIALEVPIQELTRNRAVATGPTDPNAVIGVWATSSRRSMSVINPDGTRSQQGDWVQISRLGNPLVNELVIPLGLKDAFNSLSPQFDAVAAPAILDPEIPKIIRLALGAFNGITINIPPAPRNDLVQIFATGIPVNTVTGPNFTTFLSDGQPHEYLRLNTAIPITAIGSQSRLGLLGGDVAGFPNGRRVFDDVTDIALRAVVGGTPFTPAFNVFPNNALGDGVSANPEGPLLTRFPYLLPPNPGNAPRTSNIRPITGSADEYTDDQK
ncbi:MAG: DUF4331 domain-containing protein [Pyrinomonadaceae bacterium]|nr:DUF4331 domain-containing protein [Pyrinomonadaceae bacterium]